jgi:diphthamide synthase (EF-2-diphthine--ammonia ligase)
LVVFVGARVLEFLRAFLCNSFEGEVVHEVTQASPKFRCNPLGESGDRVMQS